jgi:hypothetical protein
LKKAIATNTRDIDKWIITISKKEEELENINNELEDLNFSIAKFKKWMTLFN